MEMFELAGLVLLSLAVIQAWVKIEAKKTDAQEKIAQSQAESAITKSKIWAQSNERQEQIRTNADNYGFSEPSSTSNDFDLSGLLTLAQSPQGQQFIQTLLNKKGE